MARCDHDAAVAIKGTDRVSQQRGGKRGRHQEGVDSRGREDGGRLEREDVRVVPRVIADDGARPRSRGSRSNGVLEEGREACRCPAHHHAVHPVGTGTEGGAEPRGTELQRSTEAVFKLLTGCGDAAGGESGQLGQGCGGGRVRILGSPFAGVGYQLFKFGIARCHRNKAIVKENECRGHELWQPSQSGRPHPN